MTLRRAALAAAAIGAALVIAPAAQAAKVSFQQNGRCDAVVLDAPILASIRAETPERYGPLAGVIPTGERYEVVLPKGSALVPQVNRGPRGAGLQRAAGRDRREVADGRPDRPADAQLASARRVVIGRASRAQADAEMTSTSPPRIDLAITPGDITTFAADVAAFKHAADFYGADAAAARALQ